MDRELLAEDLIDFINSSPGAFHAVANIRAELDKAGFQYLNEGDNWNLKSGGKYYIERNSSAVISFVLGSEKPWDTGFNIVGAHTDSPLLKVKNESLKRDGGFLKLNIEAYGGGINSTWLDRDLSMAGRVSLLKDGELSNRLIDFKRSIGIIPNVAIHLNRDTNKGFEYNKQQHLSVFLATELQEDNKDIHLRDIIAKEFEIDREEIVEMDLFLYDTQKGLISGLDRDLISIGRLDNLAMCHSILKAMVTKDKLTSSAIGVFYDNEEIGSMTMQGADSNFLNSIIERIIYSLGGSLEDSYRSRSRSFMISADGAHAIHPNFSDKHDPSYAPKVNKGPVIKISANYRYATTSNSAAKFIALCREVEVPYQKMANRSDIPSGSTIGPMSSASLGIEAIDVGNPMLAMHSIRETQGVLDHYYMTKVLSHFINC